MLNQYSNFKNYSVLYDSESLEFKCFYRPFQAEKAMLFMEGKFVRPDGSAVGTVSKPKNDSVCTRGDCSECFTYETEKISVRFAEADYEIRISTQGDILLKGYMHLSEDPEDTFAGLYHTVSPVLHAASGPVTRPGDDMLFDRKADRVIRFVPCGSLKLGFDRQKNCYTFEFSHHKDAPDTGLKIQIKEHFMAERFNMRYKMIDKRNWFKTPPVGWMTWYAVRFDAGEYEVLENTRQMKELLGAYCENLVSWVDWEWYHPDKSGKCDECDVFTPRKDAYPHGLAYVADKIRENGCIPAIWVGLTNDVRLNKWFAGHRDCVLGPLPRWCGQWWLDPSRPEVYEEYIPMVMKQLLDWGYIAVKWDCLTMTPLMWAKEHDHLADPAVAPETAMYKMFAAARKTLGDNIYMLYCNPVTDSEVAMEGGLFNGSRIGGDIFDWYEFVDRAIDRLFHYFPMHNTMFYADGDNIVLREEYCTMTQARSRVSFYGITGISLTIGDRFREYDPERLYMLRRIVPVVDMHPVELQTKKGDGYTRIFVSSFSRPFGNWQVAAVMNTWEEATDMTLDFASDCRLATGGGEQYAVYDYWNQKFLGVFDRSVPLTIAPHDTVVLRITPLEKNTLPLLISSSRHLTQGGYELLDLQKDSGTGIISGIVKCVGGEAEKLTFLLADDVEIKVSGGVWSQKGHCGILSITVPENQDVHWSLAICRRV